MDIIEFSGQRIPSRLHYANPVESYPAFLKQSCEIFNELGVTIKNLCNDIKSGAWDSPVTILKGVVFEEKIGPTPSDSRSSKHSFETEAILGAIAHGLGTLFAFKEQSEGELIHNICPVKEKEFENVGECSRNPLAMHMDGVSHPYPPDYLLLYCLREDNNAKTVFTSAKDIFSSLDPQVAFGLMLPNFTHYADVELSGAYLPNFHGPVFSINEKSRLVIRYDDDLTSGGDNWSVQKQYINEAINKHKVEYALQKYDIAIIRNRDCLHGRTEFMPRYDGNDRWLQSAYVLDDRRYQAHLTAINECTLSLKDFV